MANKIIKWRSLTKSKYEELRVYDNYTLYFISDTFELYKGTRSYTNNIIPITTFPTVTEVALGKIYININTLEAKYTSDGLNWTIFNHPFNANLDDTTDDNTIISALGIRNYLAEKFTENLASLYKDATYDDDTKKIKFIKYDNNIKEVSINGFITGATLNNGIITFKVNGFNDILLNLPLDNFVKDAKFNPDSNIITLIFESGTTIDIPVGSLVDIYTAGSTDSVTNVIDNKEIKSNINISNAVGNGIVIKTGEEKGLYVPINTKLDLVTLDKANELIIANTNGQVMTSGIKIGSNILGDNKTATLAKEDAVEQAIKASSDLQIKKSDIQIAVRDIATSSDTKVPSEKAVRTAINQVITEAIEGNIITVINPDNPLDTNIVSETALVSAISWME